MDRETARFDEEFERFRPLFERAAKSIGVAESEAYLKSIEQKKVFVQPKGGRNMSFTTEMTLFVRVIDDHRVGTAFTNELSEGAVEECVARAKRLASLRPRDERLEGFPSAHERYPDVVGLCDRAALGLDFRDLNSMMDSMLGSALDSADDIMVTGGEMSSSNSFIGIINSNGLVAEATMSTLSALCSTVCGSGDRVSPECLASAMSRRNDLRLEEVGKMSSDTAECSCGTVAAETEECDVVFSPMAVGMGDAGLITVILSSGLSGMQVINESTPFEDKLGEEVASSGLSLKDAPLLPGRVGSRPFDDEGCPTRDKWLIRNGVLQGYVWDDYYGQIEGASSTGNAVRNPSSGVLTPAPLNITAEGRAGDICDLVSAVDHGYLVWGCQGAHTSNTETGDFSFVASPGLKIEKGEIVGGVKGAMVSGNILDLLRNVDAVGSDRMDFGYSFMPSMRFRDVRITTG